jgi:putative nucleotidyltransferase with HDIG domain
MAKKVQTKNKESRRSMLVMKDANFRNHSTSTRSKLTNYRRPRLFHEGLVETLARIVGLRDPRLQFHALGVASFATKLARRLGFPEEQVDLVRRASLLHDVGKLGISQELLSTSELLTERQFDIIKTHPTRGAALLQECKECQDLIPMVLHHHERFDGTGYPDGIAGENIEIEARIIAVAEAVESMESGRAYRKAFPIKHIITELERCSGTQFDPLIVKAAIPILLEKEDEDERLRRLQTLLQRS